MASAGDTQRLFFALWPGEPIRHAIYKETRQTVRASGGKPVPIENFHITLAFLGHLDAAGVSAATAAAEATVGKYFNLVLQRLGFWAEARVVWLGPADVPQASRRFAANLRQTLRARGITVDIRPFLPHVTLARKVGERGKLNVINPICWPVQEFVLVHSVTGRHASEYRVLASWPLSARAAAAGEL